MKGPIYFEKGWRISVGIVLFNKHKQIFMGERIDNKGAWQMPQGGVNILKNEQLKDAALRELLEETGIYEARIVSESKDWHYYHLPENLRKKLWGGKFIGQKQKWFLLEFEGSDKDINIKSNKKPEFCSWKWVEASKVCNQIIKFKKEIYQKVLKEFRFISI